MAEGGFDFQKFIDDSKSVLTNPKEYFTSMPKEGGLIEPLIKAVIYGTIAGIFALIWSLLHLSGASAMLGGGVGIMALVWSIIGAIIGLFIGGVIMLVISAICGGDTSYEANARVIASIMVLSPISALFSFTGGLSLFLGGIISILISLYGIWLMYNALVNALSAKEGTAKVLSLILAIIPVLMIISTLMCAKVATHTSKTILKQTEQFQNEMEKQNLDSMKKLDEFRKKMEDMEKK